ncbi:threonine dehydratase [Chelatococcus caeni]|uniref:Threonine dehydratase n=2 Tax=Chelatococcus caeni TaxID=1348468 RepID=A0A840BNN8_9HYPH|nr:threonine dehydratase [Chelatococcus caeni]
MQATPQYVWPLLCERAGATVWVKHENHTPTGAFKIRGGITFMHWLRHSHPEVSGIVTATRGNHGQSQARAAKALGLKAKIFVPLGNSREKNAAMRAFGADLVETGRDFDEAKIAAQRAAQEENLYFAPSFHPELVRGVATYALELFSAAPALDTVYVPIGLGSGICGVIAARDALALKTKIVGVVSDKADGAKLSFEAGRVVETATADTFADGMAVRIPSSEALAIYGKGAERIVAVSDDDIATAMGAYFEDTHNLVEGAGAAALAALLKERDTMRGKEVAVILSGGNIDRDLYLAMMARPSKR